MLLDEWAVSLPVHAAAVSVEYIKILRRREADVRRGRVYVGMAPPNIAPSPSWG